MIEDTGERLRCMLNPESMVFKRTAGVKARTSIGGGVAESASGDDALIYAGGGQTVLELDLLFDVSLASESSLISQRDMGLSASQSLSSITSNDVRTLTRPIWSLSENARYSVAGNNRGPLIRFVWGKSWNIRGVISAVAERLEHFSSAGVPGRSWLRMRMIQIHEEPADSSPGFTDFLDGYTPPPVKKVSGDNAGLVDGLSSYEVLGAGDLENGGLGERLDELAFRFYGDAGKWRLLAERNDLYSAGFVSSGTLLEIPPLPDGETTP